MRVNLGFKIKRLEKMRECSTTLERKCDSCTSDAIIEITFNKLEKNGGNKSKTTIRLCRRCLDEFKENIKFF